MFKYPRTFHLPWSEGVTSDDKVLTSIGQFYGKHVTVTEKMDGENTSMYRDAIHARSLDSRHHISRDWVKGFWATIRNDIPSGWRICGENLYAQHSIRYENLESYFYGFSIWNENNVALSWVETSEWFSLLGITSVPVLYSGIWDEEVIRGLWNSASGSEGYVVRLSDEFAYNDFSKSVAKFVRANHVTTDQHWMNAQITPNGLK